MCFYESVESLYSQLTMTGRERPQRVFMLSASVGNLNFDWCVIVKMVNSLLRLRQQYDEYEYEYEKYVVDTRMRYKSVVRYMEKECSL